MVMLDVLFVSPDQFRAKPQVGTPRKLTWLELAEYLSEPSIGDAKDVAGGYSPALYTDNVRRKTNLLSICVLVIDIDGNGDVDRIADELAGTDCVVHETFSSTNDDPRCRVLMRLSEAVDAETYEYVHRVARGRLRQELGVQPDDGAKDASRLSYAPVRRPGCGYRFRASHAGNGLSAARVLAANPPPPPPPPPKPIRPSHADAYRAGALRAAVSAIAAASAGARHDTLNREAYSLARLGLTLEEVEAALMPTALAAMGDARRREIQRTIADGVLARKGRAQ